MVGISEEKRRHLNRLGDQSGLFKILAIDHREVYKKSYEQSMGFSPSAIQVTESKMNIMQLFRFHASSFLIDYDYCIPAVIEHGIASSNGIMIGIEGDDYSTVDFRNDYLNPRLSVKKIKDLGSDAVKLFLYYQKEEEMRRRQESLISQIGEECDFYEIPFLLEPILLGEHDYHSQIEMLKKLSRYKIDIFKICFPGDIMNLSEKENISICNKISRNLKVPWIILSSGCDGETFKEQVRIACLGGASGFAAGRTIWDGYLKSETGCDPQSMVTQFCELCSIVSEHGQDWKKILG